MVSGNKTGFKSPFFCYFETNRISIRPVAYTVKCQQFTFRSIHNCTRILNGRTNTDHKAYKTLSLSKSTPCKDQLMTNIKAKLKSQFCELRNCIIYLACSQRKSVQYGTLSLANWKHMGKRTSVLHSGLSRKEGRKRVYIPSDECSIGL